MEVNGGACLKLMALASTSCVVFLDTFRCRWKTCSPKEVNVRSADHLSAGARKSVGTYSLRFVLFGLSSGVLTTTLEAWPASYVRGWLRDIRGVEL